MIDNHHLTRLLTEAREARQLGAFASAKQSVERLLELAEATGQRETWLAALNLDAQLERDLGHDEAALARYETLAEAYAADGDELSRAHALRHQADIHCDAGHLGRAAAAYAKALQMHRDAGDTRSLQMANALRGYALLMGQLEERERARVFWTEARGLYLSAGVMAGVEECDHWLRGLDEP